MRDFKRLIEQNNKELFEEFLDSCFCGCCMIDGLGDLILLSVDQAKNTIEKNDVVIDYVDLENMATYIIVNGLEATITEC